MKANRDFLRCDYWEYLDDIETDQRLDKPRPEVQKAYSEDFELVDLISPGELHHRRYVA